jgi:hypothetical protein
MNWNSGEPNNAGSSENAGEIYASGSNPGKWNDLPASNTLGYIVEYGGLASDPVVSLTASRTMSISISPLPITGMRFYARKGESTTDLSWSTETEINSSRFEIERSNAGGNNFLKIGEIKAAGNSDSKRSYQWSDQQPQSGINYYRLKEVDIDDKNTYSDVKIIVFPVTGAQLSPNPATSNINISLAKTSNNSGTTSIVILNMNGQPVIQKKLTEGQQSVSIDISELSPGTYIAQIITNASAEKIKFIKK